MEASHDIYRYYDLSRLSPAKRPKKKSVIPDSITKKRRRVVDHSFASAESAIMSLCIAEKLKDPAYMAMFHHYKVQKNPNKGAENCHNETTEKNRERSPHHLLEIFLNCPE